MIDLSVTAAIVSLRDRFMTGSLKLTYGINNPACVPLSEYENIAWKTLMRLVMLGCES